MPASSYATSRCVRRAWQVWGAPAARWPVQALPGGQCRLCPCPACAVSRGAGLAASCERAPPAPRPVVTALFVKAINLPWSDELCRPVCSLAAGRKRLLSTLRGQQGCCLSCCVSHTVWAAWRVGLQRAGGILAPALPPGSWALPESVGLSAQLGNEL